MSGHSHFKSIKRIKEASDKKRSQIFSKMTRLIWVAVKEGGPNPETNSRLRLVIELARSVNMPKENIERAIKRASGEVAGEKLEEFLFEAYGPGGIALLIEGITDNKNRSLNEIKQILNQNKGKLVSEGAVRWMFEKKGCISLHSGNLEELGIKNKDDLEIMAIEAGAENFYWQNDVLNIYTKIEDLEKVKKSLEEKGIKIDSTSLDWTAKDLIEVNEEEKEACQKLFEALDENEAVQEIYSNLKI